MLSACYLVDFRAPDPLPTQILPPRVASSAPPLFIVLPGRGDNLADLRQSGIGASVQDAIPEAEVVLVGATIGYYRKGRIISALHDQILAPARDRGMNEIWLVGISLGGMGAILYDHDYPSDLRGLVLFSPYLGEADLVDEVRSAGGPPSWNPGIVPDQIGPETATRMEWVTVKRWSADPERVGRVWLACGTHDRLRDSSALLAPLLPSSQVFAPEGTHDWTTWLPISRQLFLTVERARQFSEGIHRP